MSQYGRWGHSCNIIGKRQMISIGGLVTNSTLNLTRYHSVYISQDSIPDPWQQGIGIFDMSAMQWSDSYDHAAAPYVTPDMVKTYCQQNGREPASWSNDIAKSWFTESSVTESAPQRPDPASQTGLVDSSRSMNINAIVGGTVGAVAAIAFVALLALFLLRRRRRRIHSARQPATLSSGPVYHKAELSSDYETHQASDIAPSFPEMNGKDDPRELRCRDQVPEMDCGQNLHEAP